MEQNPPNKHLVPLAIVVAGGLVAVAIYFGGTGDKPPARVANEPQGTASQLDVAPVTDRDHIFGNAEASIVVVEYSDTECPYCKIFHNTMHQVIQDYDGQVAWVYRHFPIAQLHAKAAKEAEATECAAELGGNQAFWKYIDRLFEITGSNDSLDPNELPKIATFVGLDEQSFNTCLSSGRYSELVTKGVEEAVKAGARGTPYSVIISKNNNQKIVINGAEPIASVKSKIDALLK